MATYTPGQPTPEPQQGGLAQRVLSGARPTAAVAPPPQLPQGNYQTQPMRPPQRAAQPQAQGNQLAQTAIAGGARIAEGMMERRAKDKARMEAMEAEQYTRAMSDLEKLRYSKANMAESLLQREWQNVLASNMKAASMGEAVDWEAAMGPVFDKVVSLSMLTPTAIDEYMRSFGIDATTDKKFGGLFRKAREAAADTTTNLVGLYGNEAAFSKFGPGLRELLTPLHQTGQQLVLLARQQGDEGLKQAAEEAYARFQMQGAKMVDLGGKLRDAHAEQIFGASIFDDTLDPNAQAQMVDAHTRPADRLAVAKLTQDMANNPALFLGLGSTDFAVHTQSVAGVVNAVLPDILGSYMPHLGAENLRKLATVITDPRATMGPEQDFAMGQNLMVLGRHLARAANSLQASDEETLNATAELFKPLTEGGAGLSAETVQATLATLSGALFTSGSRMTRKLTETATTLPMLAQIDALIHDRENAGASAADIMSGMRDILRDRTRAIAEWSDPLSPENMQEAFPEIKSVLDEAEGLLKTSLSMWGADYMPGYDPVTRQFVMPYVPDENGTKLPGNSIRGTGLDVDSKRRREALAAQTPPAQQGAGPSPQEQVEAATGGLKERSAQALGEVGNAYEQGGVMGAGAYGALGLADRAVAAGLEAPGAVGQFLAGKKGAEFGNDMAAMVLGARKQPAGHPAKSIYPTSDKTSTDVDLTGTPATRGPTRWTKPTSDRTSTDVDLKASPKKITVVWADGRTEEVDPKTLSVEDYRRIVKMGGQFVTTPKASRSGAPTPGPYVEPYYGR